MPHRSVYKSIGSYPMEQKTMSKDEMMMWLYDIAEQMRLGMVVMPSSGRIEAVETAMEVIRDADTVSKKSVC